jgi:hypothetical protein
MQTALYGMGDKTHNEAVRTGGKCFTDSSNVRFFYMSKAGNIQNVRGSVHPTTIVIKKTQQNASVSKFYYSLF